MDKTAAAQAQFEDKGIASRTWDSASNKWDSLDPNIRSTLATGLGGGAIGGGLGYLMSGDREGESRSARRRRILMNALLGAGLGSLAGTGLNYGKTLLDEGLAPTSDDISEDRAFQGGTIGAGALAGGVGAEGLRRGILNLMDHTKIQQGSLDHFNTKYTALHNAKTTLDARAQQQHANMPDGRPRPTPMDLRMNPLLGQVSPQASPVDRFQAWENMRNLDPNKVNRGIAINTPTTNPQLIQQNLAEMRRAGLSTPAGTGASGLLEKIIGKLGYGGSDASISKILNTGGAGARDKALKKFIQLDNLRKNVRKAGRLGIAGAGALGGGYLASKLVGTDSFN
jgi:hypothetical protein